MDIVHEGPRFTVELPEPNGDLFVTLKSTGARVRIGSSSDGSLAITNAKPYGITVSKIEVRP